MRHFGKRGMDDKLAFIMWEIMVIFMVVIALTISVKGIANNSTYWKKYHAADLALMTDLILTNQGDFEINYNMKELKSTPVSKILGIDNLVFQTTLTNDAYFLYDTSKEDDRFPQSYVFAKTSKIKIIPSETTSSNIVLTKTGDSFSMTQGEIQIETSCPSLDTLQSLANKNIMVISTSDNLKDTSKYITETLKTAAKGQEPELLIVLSNSNSDKNRIYYNIDNGQVEKSNKLSCLIKKQLVIQNELIEIQEIPYDNSLNIEPFTSQKDKYNNWIILEINKDIINQNILTNSLRNTIIEYYGPQD